MGLKQSNPSAGRIGNPVHEDKTLGKETAPALNGERGVHVLSRTAGPLYDALATKAWKGRLLTPTSAG